jgi:hypothetical protein
MNYAEYIPTPAELVEIAARHRQEETDFHGIVLRELLDLGREIIAVQRQKVFVQEKQLAGAPRDIELRHHKDLTIPFERLARGIRAAILLHQKILDLLKPPPAEPTPDAKTDQPPDEIIAKACHGLAAGLGPNITIPDTGPRAAIETLRAHLAATVTGPP